MVVSISFLQYCIQLIVCVCVCVCVDYLMTVSVSEVIEALVRDSQMGMMH
jgi:hypothetical protein